MAERRLLLSWKQVSAYTGRGVRTLQRYESTLGFPIHRPAGKLRSSVLAFADEIDAWLGRAPRRTETGSTGQLLTLSKGEIRTCFSIAEKATQGRLMAASAHAASIEQRKRVEAMMLKFEKYRKPKAA